MTPEGQEAAQKNRLLRALQKITAFPNIIGEWLELIQPMEDQRKEPLLQWKVMTGVRRHEE